MNVQTGQKTCRKQTHLRRIYVCCTCLLWMYFVNFEIVCLHWIREKEKKKLFPLRATTYKQRNCLLAKSRTCHFYVCSEILHRTFSLIVKMNACHSNIRKRVVRAFCERKKFSHCLARKETSKNVNFPQHKLISVRGKNCQKRSAS